MLAKTMSDVSELSWMRAKQIPLQSEVLYSKRKYRLYFKYYWKKNIWGRDKLKIVLRYLGASSCTTLMDCTVYLLPRNQQRLFCSSSI